MKDDVFSGNAADPTKGTRQPLCRAVSFCFMLTIFAFGPAMAEPRSIEDCEKIQAADAYNQCLASFGPVAHERGVTADPEGANGGHSGGGTHASRRGHGSHASHGRGHKYSSRHQASRHLSSRHADPWAHMRHAGGRHRAEFRVK